MAKTVGPTSGQRRPFGALRRRLARLFDNTDRLLSVLAVFIGLVTGLGAVGFSALIDLVREFYFQYIGTILQSHGLYLWLLPLLPMSGALLVGLITYYLAPEAEGHGVPEVMDAMARKGGRIRLRVAGAKAVASSLTIGSGGSAGTEGPIIQIGAALGSGIGQRLNLGLTELRVLIGCGAAAGIAAIFNAPIAGVLFAVEVLLRDVSLRSFVPIIISSVASSTLTQAMRGSHDPIFPVPTEFLSHTSISIYTFSIGQIGNYVVLGLLCGVVGWAFVKLLYFTEDLFRKMPGHRVFRPVVGAALLGLLALGSDALTETQRPGAVPRLIPLETPAVQAAHGTEPAIMGNGYPVIKQTLEPNAYAPATDPHAHVWTIYVLLILLAAKIVATALTLGSGGSGGVFAPSLFMGAATGGIFGIVVQSTGWFTTVTPGAYALVGMAAVVAASIHAPLTATLMLFELTGDYEVILPIMLAGVIGLAVAKRMEPASIYTMKLLRRGVDMYRGQDVSVLKHVLVRDEMRTDAVTVAPEAGLMQVIAAFVEHRGTSIFVIDRDRRLLGLITGQQSRSIMADAAAFKDILIAHDIMIESDYPTVRPGDTLADVMKQLARYRGEVPVVEDGRLVGVMWPENVIERYNTEILKRDMASSMASTIGEDTRSERIPMMENTSLLEIPVPRRFVGQSLGSLDIRNRYNVTILLIKHPDGAGDEVVNAVPSAAYIFQAGDRMLVMGPDDRLQRLARGRIVD